jgi:hypothetical protein
MGDMREDRDRAGKVRGCGRVKVGSLGDWYGPGGDRYRGMSRLGNNWGWAGGRFTVLAAIRKGAVWLGGDGRWRADSECVRRNQAPLWIRVDERVGKIDRDSVSPTGYILVQIILTWLTHAFDNYL